MINGLLVAFWFSVGIFWVLSGKYDVATLAFGVATLWVRKESGRAHELMFRIGGE